MGGLRRFWGSCRRATVLAPLHINKMDTSTGGPSQQPGPTPAALVLARSGGMPRVGALRLAASSAPTRPVPQRAIAARQEEEQSRLAIGPGPVQICVRRVWRFTRGHPPPDRWVRQRHTHQHVQQHDCMDGPQSPIHQHHHHLPAGCTLQRPAPAPRRQLEYGSLQTTPSLSI